VNFVLDTSVTMAWLFEDEASPHTERLLDRLQTDEALVPSLWRYEVGNVLVMAVRRKGICDAQGRRFAELLDSLPIHIAGPHTPALWDGAVIAARTHKLSVYDGAYLDLAMREGASLATLDNALKAAAKKSGVEIL
jgi:predicted nucleic acid-binding protein